MIKATYINHMGNDNSVVQAARVSFDKDPSQYSEEANEKLIKYLAEHNHISPFGHCFASFHVKAPIFVARQLVKHKFLRWNEISRRYVDSVPELYIPDVWRGRAEDKKQGSSGVIDLEAIDSMGMPPEDDYFLSQGDSLRIGFAHDLATYQDLLKRGVCPEQARMVLPQNTMTEWYWSGSLDAFADMYNLRSKEDTQLETRMVASDIGAKMTKLYPISWKELTR